MPVRRINESDPPPFGSKAAVVFGMRKPSTLLAPSSADPDPLTGNPAEDVTVSGAASSTSRVTSNSG